MKTHVSVWKEIALQWRHNGRDGVSNHQPHDCLLSRLFKAQIKENTKVPRHWPLWGELKVILTDQFPAQRVSNAEMVPSDDVIMETYTSIHFMRKLCNHSPSSDPFCRHYLILMINRWLPGDIVFRLMSKGTDVFPQYLVKPRSREIQIYTFPTPKKLTGCSAVEMPVKFESDYDHYNIQSRCFETSWDLAVRRPSA